ncbi:MULTISPECIES: hypothetical protein [Tenacibaculum]|uniref:hypothetical protein n=1 Tax=Tenacibaculum TaxID=104267 RepID=UPI001F0A8112|nr:MULTISPECIES: hypothetical protein [Tenacibaculum]MCH3882345.1 hypothetical protein [Tenacibaculum aquimarinum]MDO6600988.1 hypothetical protein [Tenacibaculum sp. 1_MG-2023]
MSFSILNNKETILYPNSQFERRVILQYYLDNDIEIDKEERKILLKCIAVEPESIGIIGCLLNDKTHLNTLRLAIGSMNKSNSKLANLATKYLEELSIEEADNYYYVEKDFDEFTDIEKDVESVYNIVYFPY